MHPYPWIVGFDKTGKPIEIQARTPRLFALHTYCVWHVEKVGVMWGRDSAIDK